jgi:predicted phosphohydrolase
MAMRQTSSSGNVKFVVGLPGPNSMIKSHVDHWSQLSITLLYLSHLWILDGSNEVNYVLSSSCD